MKLSHLLLMAELHAVLEPGYSADELPPEPVMDVGYGPRGGTPSRGKVRDTKPEPKPRKRERRGPRHTQRRRR